jgi:hypothetical protein
MPDKFEPGPVCQPIVSKSDEPAPIRSVEGRADWRARKWARKRMATRCEEDRFPEVAEAYRRGDRDEFLRDEIEAYLAGAAASSDREEILEARVAELEAALAKADEPEWFHSAEDSAPEHSLEDAIEANLYDSLPGRYLVEIDTARRCKTIWGVVHVLTDEEIEARRDDEPWVFTPCAPEAAALALLKESDQ